LVSRLGIFSKMKERKDTSGGYSVIVRKTTKPCVKILAPKFDFTTFEFQAMA